MDGGHFASGERAQRRTAFSERAGRYGVQAVRPVREVRALLSPHAVPYEVRGVEVRVNPRLLSYVIPFVAGVGLMIGGMKTAGTTLVAIPQLIVGMVLTAVAGWDFVSDSGRLDLGRPQPQPAWRPAEDDQPGAANGSTTGTRRRTYDEKFRRHAVHMVRSTGKPVAAVARDLDVNPGTLRGWVKKERQERERLTAG